MNEKSSSKDGFESNQSPIISPGISDPNHIKDKNTKNNNNSQLPATYSTPIRNNRNTPPLVKTNEQVPSFQNTPSLKERISPFSFRLESTIIPKLESKNVFKTVEKSNVKVPKKMICNCRVTDCKTSKCKCKKQGLICSEFCKCSANDCKNLQKKIDRSDFSFKSQLESPLHNLDHVKLKKINKKNHSKKKINVDSGKILETVRQKREISKNQKIPEILNGEKSDENFKMRSLKKFSM